LYVCRQQSDLLNAFLSHLESLSLSVRISNEKFRVGESGAL
jgi:hypothetical protein